MALKQGFGRLIRSAADRGLLDKRILKQAYGKIFFDSLPDYTFTTCLQDVEDFLNPEDARCGPPHTAANGCSAGSRRRCRPVRVEWEGKLWQAQS